MNPFKVLGLDETATLPAVAQAYRKRITGTDDAGRRLMTLALKSIYAKSKGEFVDNTTNPRGEVTPSLYPNYERDWTYRTFEAEEGDQCGATYTFGGRRPGDKIRKATCFEPERNHHDTPGCRCMKQHHPFKTYVKPEPAAPPVKESIFEGHKTKDLCIICEKKTTFRSVSPHDQQCEGCNTKLPRMDKGAGYIISLQKSVTESVNEDFEVPCALEEEARVNPLDHEAHHGKKVFVYYNLHNKHWSVRHKGKIIGHTTHVSLDKPQFKVSEPGRQRVLATKRKNVHAGVFGTLNAKPHDASPEGKTRVSYNPYKAGHFTVAGTDAPVHHGDSAHLSINDTGTARIPALHVKNHRIHEDAEGNPAAVDASPFMCLNCTTPLSNDSSALQPFCNKKCHSQFHKTDQQPEATPGDSNMAIQYASSQNQEKYRNIAPKKEESYIGQEADELAMYENLEEATASGFLKRASSVEYKMHAPFHQGIRSLARQLIPEHESIRGKGHIKVPHITVHDGIQHDSHEHVESALHGESHAKVTFGDLDVGEGHPHFDVVMMKVHSEDLHRQHQKLKTALTAGGVGSTVHPGGASDYNPHITLGYVTKGEGAKYKGMKHPLSGKTAHLKEMNFMNRQAERKPIALGGAHAASTAA